MADVAPILAPISTIMQRRHGPQDEEVEGEGIADDRLEALMPPESEALLEPRPATASGVLFEARPATASGVLFESRPATASKERVLATADDGSLASTSAANWGWAPNTS